MLRTSLSDTFMATSASSAGVVGSPTSVSSRTKPTELACCPFASGVPTVRFGDACCGGLHEANASGAPCVSFGEVHSWYAGTSDARNGRGALRPRVLRELKSGASV